MNKKACERFQPHLEPWFDRQLDGNSRLDREISEHVKHCPHCGPEIAALEALHERLAATPKPETPAYLRDRIAGIARESRQAEQKVVKLRRRQYWVGGLLAAASLALVIGFGIINQDPTSDAQLARYFNDHVELVQAENGARLISSNPAEMEQWFAQRLNYVPKLPQWEWAEPVSAHLGMIKGERVARVQYRVDGEEMTVFVRTSDPESMAKHAGAYSPSTAIVCALRGFRIHCWEDKGLEYVLVAHETATKIFDRLDRKEA